MCLDGILQQILSHFSKVQQSFITYLTTRSLDSEHASQHTLSQSLSPEIGTVAAGRVYGVKGCMAELTLALICVAAAGQLVVVQ